METVSRNVWADVMKGLAMVFVVFGHANLEDDKNEENP